LDGEAERRRAGGARARRERVGRGVQGRGVPASRGAIECRDHLGVFARHPHRPLSRERFVEPSEMEQDARQAVEGQR
jgi:hypothetical protein